jgi:hypothetical protein
VSFVASPATDSAAQATRLAAGLAT